VILSEAKKTAELILYQNNSSQLLLNISGAKMQKAVQTQRPLQYSTKRQELSAMITI
jgi:hypothetical protein